MRRILVVLAGMTLMVVGFSSAQDEEPIVIGAIATLEGPFAGPGEDGLRGVELAISQFGGEINGRPIELIRGSTDANPDVAVAEARRLVEQQGVDILIGPLSGDEGIAIRDYAKTQPDVTFVNGASAAADTTLRDSAENFFRFSTEGTQWMAGLGNYAVEEKGYGRVATVAEDYSFPYSQVGGFVLGFCESGGEIVDQYWTPLGASDYSSVVTQLVSQDVDAIYVALGGSDAVNFLRQYQQFGGTAPLIAGSITVDSTVLETEGAILDAVVGTITSSPISPNNPSEAWEAFVTSYSEMFPDGLESPSLFAHAYFVNTTAVMLGLEAVGGDLSDGQQAFRTALAELEFESPTGTVTLDANRQAVASIFINEVVLNDEDELITELVSIAENVNQTLGFDEASFLAMGAFDRENPTCESVAQMMGEE